MIEKKEYIGLLDSGVGGLSVLKQLNLIMADKNYVFFGDTKNVPYGTKSQAQIVEYTTNILEYFTRLNVKHVVIACNTTSAVGYDILAEKFRDKLNIIPLIQTASKEAAYGLSSGDTIVVLATRATITSHKYREEILQHNSNLNVIELDCTGFVEIVENRLYEDKSSFELIKSKLDIAKQNKAKRVVLGCTHYPYLVDIFKKIYDTDYFDPAKATSKIAKSIIGEDCRGNSREFFVSSNPDEFIKSARMFFNVEKAKLVELVSV